MCSKGTYIRVLAEELAAGLGTLGHLSALRRLWVEPFAAAPMVTLEQIEALGRRPATALRPSHAPRVQRSHGCSPSTGPFRICRRCASMPRARCTCARARVLPAPGDVCVAPHVRVYDEHGKFPRARRSHRRSRRSGSSDSSSPGPARRSDARPLSRVAILRLKYAAQFKEIHKVSRSSTDVTVHRAQS